METVQSTDGATAGDRMTAAKSVDDLRPMELPALTETPLVSVLVANYNYARYVGATIESVLGQSYPHFELIIADDGSSDDSVRVIKEYAAQDDRVRLVELPENRGMAAATNAAFAQSGGKIICLLDSDDLYYPAKLEQVVRQFQSEPATGLIVHPLTIIRGEGTPVQQIPFLTRFERGWIAKRMVQRGGRWRDMPTSALCLRREVASVIFPIPEKDFRRASDGYLFTLAPLLTEVSSIVEPLAMYRVHAENDYAALGLNARTLESDERFIRLQVEQVNDRVDALFGISRIFDLNRHLVYRQNVLLAGMLRDQSRSWLLKEYLSISRLLLRDDLYSRKQKAFGLFAYGLAIPLPGVLRYRWLSIFFGYNDLKRRVQILRNWFSARSSQRQVARQ